MERNEFLLSDLEEGIPREPASMGVRLANYIIDTIGFYVVFIAVVFLIASMQPQGDTGYYEDDTITSSQLIDVLLTAAIYILYFTLFEGLTKGRSLGKLITGTVAIQQDGDPINWNDALMRSLSRIVPFEPFSALGSAPWHDSWTRTTVVKKHP